MVDLKRILHKLRFFHPVDVAGHTMKGRWNVEHQEWKASLLPESFEGKSVLDVGCNDGYFSFIAENRGAREVLAIDDPWDPDEQCVDSRAIMAAIILNQSRVIYRTGSVYDLEYLRRKFDTVLFLEVLYHLKHPILALEQIARACSGELYLCTYYIEGDDAIAKIHPGHETDTTLWFVPTLTTLEIILKGVGFGSSEVLARKRDRAFVRAWDCNPDRERRRSEIEGRIGLSWLGR